MELDVINIVLESFFTFWRACRNTAYTFFVCKGGRNSAKSTTIAQWIITYIMDKPVTALVIRKVGNTLEESCYEQLKEATVQLGVETQFTFTRKPLKITFKKTGNSIIFRGADDPAKLKSIKVSKFPIAIAWFEELSDFKLEEDVQTIVDSVLRENLPDKLRYRIFFSYNPPKRKQHWVNKKFETQFIPDNYYIHHSTYLDNPFLSEQTIQDINNTKATNKRKYDWIYLGKPIGGGIVPFDNLTFRAIKEDEFKTFDNVREGIDWGYAVDPFAYAMWHFDKTRNIIYAMHEVYGVKMSNREAYGKIRNITCSTITADSAEPKSIAEMKELGLRIRGAKKGQGSVEYGEKWLDDLTEIVIDPKRTPNIAREFENIDYEVDRDGNLKARLEDKDNHSIDLTRYAFEKDMKRQGFRFV